MAYDLTNFTDYVARESATLTATLFAGGDTAKFAMYMTGVKGKTEVPHVSGGATLQAGTCNTPSGTTNADVVSLEVAPFTYFESFCQDDLQSKFPNTVLAPGSNNADTPAEWEEALINEKVASIAEQLELQYWQGDTDGSEYTLFDGFIKQIDAATGVIAGNTSSATEITKANVIGLVDDMRVAAPAKVKRSKDFVILVGDDVFDKYIAAEKDANLYHYAPEHDNGVYRIGGSGAKLIRTYGLDGTDRMFASVGKNFIVGSDVANEESVMDVWYDKTDDKTHMRVKAKAGVTIANPAEIVEFTLSS